MIVRKATLSDIPAVAALERAEFPDGADEGMLTRLWETDGGVILAAGEGDALLGYVWARFVLDEGEIGNIAVAPERRRCGVGAALLGALFADACLSYLLSGSLKNSSLSSLFRCGSNSSIPSIWVVPATYVSKRNISFSKGFGMEISPPLLCNSPTSPLPPDLTKSPIISPQHFFDFRIINGDKLVILFKDTFKFLLLLLSFLCILKNILHCVWIL